MLPLHTMAAQSGRHTEEPVPSGDDKQVDQSHDIDQRPKVVLVENSQFAGAPSFPEVADLISDEDFPRETQYNEQRPVTADSTQSNGSGFDKTEDGAELSSLLADRDGPHLDSHATSHGPSDYASPFLSRPYQDDKSEEPPAFVYTKPASKKLDLVGKLKLPTSHPKQPHHSGKTVTDRHAQGISIHIPTDITNY